MPFVPFRSLRFPDSTGLPVAWGVWEPGDQVGMLNNITPASTIEGARLVRIGTRFNLNLPLHEPLGAIPAGAHVWRRGPRRNLFKGEYEGLVVRDDKLEELYLQASTQWDGLTHVGDPVLGYYNGVQDQDITQGADTKNGVDHYVKFGIATRGVLVDLPRFFESKGMDWSVVGSRSVGPEVLVEALAYFNIQLLQGTALLVRTGWVSAFRAAATDDQRERLFKGRDYSGLSGGREMWEFLWDNRISALASDNVTVEAWPLTRGQPSLHLAIARLGLILGEMFDLDGLADACVEDQRYEFFFVSAPLNLRGGVGSPANAMAIK